MRRLDGEERLPFRATKDLDIVLVIEALEPEFVSRFKDFVRSGRYQVRTRQETGTREFFRFMKPEEPDFPFMLELFARSPSGLELGPGNIDLADIKKHRNDVFRLALTLPAVPGPARPQRIMEVVRSFLDAFPEGNPEWTSIHQALKGTVRTPPAAADLLRTLSTYFRVETT